MLGERPRKSVANLGGVAPSKKNLSQGAAQGCKRVHETRDDFPPRRESYGEEGTWCTNDSRSELLFVLLTAQRRFAGRRLERVFALLVVVLLDLRLP